MDKAQIKDPFDSVFPEQPALLEVKNLVKSFPGQEAVLKDINLQVQPGEVIHISGVNGSGKSTLLKILAGLMEPDEGSISKSRGRIRVGALIGNPEFSGMLTLKENLDFLYSLRNQKPDVEKLNGLCADFDLDYHSRKPMRSYSVGMKEKAGIIQAVMENQNLILLDEPTRGLDSESVEKLKELISRLSKEGKSILIASHDPEDLGYTRRLKLERGSFIQE